MMTEDVTAGVDVRPMRRRGVMRKAFAGNFLDDGYRPRRKLRNNSEAAAYLQGMALSDLGGVPVTESSPRSDERIARTLAAEFIAAVDRTGGKSAMDWYTRSIERTVALAAMLHPEVGSDEAARAMPHGRFGSSAEARTVLFCAMAITSQNVPVSENMGYALEQYRIFRETGRFEPKGYGIRGASVEKNLARFNHLVDVAEGDLSAVGEFLSTEFRMGDLRSAAEKVGLKLGGRELNDETVWGSMIFGPKIGNGFYQNLSGNMRPVTIDLWFMRTWGRITGTLVRNEVSEDQLSRLVAGLGNFGPPYEGHALQCGFDPGADLTAAEPEDLLDACRALHASWEKERRRMSDVEGIDNASVSAEKARLGWPSAAHSIIKSLAMTVDAPANAGQRRWIRAVVRRSLDILADHGYRSNSAELQANLWYPEKSIYQFLIEGRITDALNVSYDEALVRIAKKEGWSDDDIAGRLRALEPNGGGRPGGAGRVGQGDGRPIQGLPPRVDGQGGPDTVLAAAVGAAAAAGGRERVTEPDEEPAFAP